MYNILKIIVKENHTMTKKILSALLAALILLPCIASCQEYEISLPTKYETPTETETDAPTEFATDETRPRPQVEPQKLKLPNIDLGNDKLLDENTFANGLSIGGVDISEFSIVYATEGKAVMNAQKYALELAAWIKETVGVELPIFDDTNAAVEHEILFGDTDRLESVVSGSFPVETRYDFTAYLDNGKLAITAISAEGFYAALGSFKNAMKACGGAITRGFRNNSLTQEKIASISTGYAALESTPDGLQFLRCTNAQNKQWANTPGASAEYSRYANGCRIDIVTDSSFFYFSVSGGSCTVLLNGSLKRDGVIANFLKLEEEGNDLNRITVILPPSDYRNWTLTDVQVDCGAYFEAHKTDLNMLFLGDGITQGHKNYGNEANAYTFCTAEYFNATSLMQANHGATFDPDFLDPELAFDPDVIVVAMGTMDWSRFRSSKSVDEFKALADAYVTKLKEIYPDVPVIYISPINRFDGGGEWATPFDDAKAAFSQAFNDHGCFVVDGAGLLPSDRKFYADNIYPNYIGHGELAKNLCSAIEKYVNDIKNAKVSADTETAQ